MLKLWFLESGMMVTSFLALNWGWFIIMDLIFQILRMLTTIR
jgi:hypothetical protein